MGLLQRHLSFRLIPRYYSQKKTVQKSVFISQSKDVYTNLALEDWLYRNLDFSNHHLLMVYQNDPCVTVGRHQNPWLEANVPELPNITKSGVKLARRRTGGGAVYQDQGNLNLTFFTSRDTYNGRYNLELIARALFRQYFTKVEISAVEDLDLRNNKVSGTAAKLGQDNAYHQCSLLVNINKVNYNQALQTLKLDVETSATRSYRPKIRNLAEDNPKITVPSLIKAIGWEFLRTPAGKLTDGGLELANQQKGFQMINPTDMWFPGLRELEDDLKSWSWCFGKTPKFTVNRSFAIPDCLDHQDLVVNIEVDGGRIVDVKMFIPPGLAGNGFTGNVDVATGLVGQKFCDDIITKLDWSFGNLLNIKDRFLMNSVKQVMSSA